MPSQSYIVKSTNKAERVARLATQIHAALAELAKINNEQELFSIDFNTADFDKNVQISGTNAADLIELVSSAKKAVCNGDDIPYKLIVLNSI